MRLYFSILWFDDREDYFDSVNTDFLNSEIESWGFSPNIVMVSNPDDFHENSPFEKFDLIVVDRNLEGYPQGQEFISELRNNAVYTEVIFYTADNINDLWDAVREKQLEGVFVSSRRDVETKISLVGRQSVKKVLDLENMRGIVMAEVGELDHLLDDILTLGFNGLSDDTLSVVFKKFHKEAEKQNVELGDRLKKFIEGPTIEEMIAMCDSNKRWESFNRLWKYHEKLKNKDKIGDYKVEVLDIRNALAHGTPTDIGEGRLFGHRGKEFLYNEKSSEALRISIMKYKKEFKKVLEVLKT